MNNLLIWLGFLGFFGLIATSIYETWLGVSLRQPSMTRILFGASVSLKVLLIVVLSYVLVGINRPDIIRREFLGHELREYLRAISYGGLALQTVCVSIALFRWDRRAVRVRQEDAEEQLVTRQRELHRRIRRGIDRDE